MKLLVTGGAGFIGSNFIKYWLEKHPKDKIVNLDVLTYAGNLDNTKKFQSNKNYRFIYGDIRDEELVDRLMSEADVAVHFAAESHVDRSIENPELFLETNILGTGVLLRSALKNEVEKFHYISTDEVFGALKLHSRDKFQEDTLYDPRSPYSASKAGADHLVRSYYHTYGLPITITNCSNNFGPYQSVEKFIPRAITNAIDNEPIKIYGDGKYVRDWLHVEDHCTAIEKVIKKGKDGETYLVGGQKEETDNLTIAETILEILEKPKSLIEFVSDRPGHDRKYAVDWAKIRRDLKWKPKINFRDRMEETVGWYTENEWYWRPQKKEVEKFYDKIKR